MYQFSLADSIMMFGGGEIFLSSQFVLLVAGDAGDGEETVSSCV